MRNFNGGYLIFVHDTEGVTLIRTAKSRFKDVNLNKDNRIEFGDTDGKIISVYVIEASDDDFSLWHGSATSKKRSIRRDSKAGEDSTEIMKNQRDYVIKKRDDLSNALKNKTIKKIYDLLTDVGFEIKETKYLPIVVPFNNGFRLLTTGMGIKQDAGPNISFFIGNVYESSISKIDNKVVTSVEISVSSSGYDYSKNNSDEITDEYYKVAEVSKAISKVSNILKNSTYRDLMIE